MAGVTNYYKLGGLEHQVFIFSQFWPEISNQGVSRVTTLPLKALGEGPS